MPNNTTSGCDRVLSQAVGKWYGILARFGIEVGDGKHTACPICGPGKNSHRFRFDDKKGRGTWICTQCGSGDGLGLLMKKLNIGFVEACEEVAKVIGFVESHPIKQEKEVSPEKLRELFKASRPIIEGDPVTEYLKNRGLSTFPKSLRYAPKCWEFETKQDQKAMLAIFSQSDGEAITIHRTFIKDGKKLDIKSPKKVMPSLRKMAGGAVRLFSEETYTLGICEGIETAIAVKELFDVNIWAALSSALLEAFVPPVWAKRIEIFSDQDENYAGQKSAHILANRLIVKDKIPAVIKMPEKGDFLEDLINDNK